MTTASGMPVLRTVTFGAFSELQRLVTGAATGVQDVWNGYLALRSVHDENAVLRQQLQDMQIRLQQERALAQRTEDLRQLLELRQRAELETTAAEIIAAGASPEFRSVTIDKGTSSRVQADMAVLSPSGVVGRVTLPSMRSSQVQLLIDRNAAAGADPRTIACAGRGGGHRSRRAAHGLRAGDGRREDRRKTSSSPRASTGSTRKGS